MQESKMTTDETRRRLTRAAFIQDWIGAQKVVEDALASGLPNVESLWKEAQIVSRQLKNVVPIVSAIEILDRL